MYMIKNHGKKTAITYKDQHISYTELFREFQFFSTKFKIDTGQHCVIFSENSLSWIYAFYSIWFKKGVVIPIDHLSTVPEITYLLKDCKPTVVFCSENGKLKMQEAIYNSGLQIQFILIDELIGACPQDFPVEEMPDFEAEDTASIIYTSGTTGSPKGVMLSFKNLEHNTLAVAERIHIYDSESRVMVLLPLHHIFPMMGSVVIPLYMGGSIAICPSMAGGDIISTLQENKITIIIGVPRLYAVICKGVMDKINASFTARLIYKTAKLLKWKAFSRLVFGSVHKKFGGALTYLVAGGAALDTQVGNVFQTLGFDVLEGYGMTEASPMISFTRPGRVRIGSPGEIVPGTTVKIVEDEILASGDNIMQGYYNRPEETAEILHDGWLYTGDMGYVDKDGYLFITGRKKEIIVLSNGKNINPNEIEEYLLNSEIVEDCGVFCSDDKLHLIVYPPADIESKLGGLSMDDYYRANLVKPYNESVSSYKKINKIHFIYQELPRTRLGKLQHFKLPSLIEQKKEAQKIESFNDNPVFALITSYFKTEKKIDVHPSDNIEADLAMDSLDKVSFQTWIYNTFGVVVDTSAMASSYDLMSLCEFIIEKKTKMENTKVNWSEILKEKVQLKLPRTWFTGNLIAWGSRLFFKTYFRFHSTGMKNIPDGPAIIVSNHQTFLDGLFVASMLKYKQVRGTYFYAKEKHVRKRLVRFFANRNNVIIMDLNKDLKESIQKLGEVLKRNKKIIIFPEGTRTTTGKLGEFKKTFAILSRELDVPIVPVAISGAYTAFPAGSHIPRPWKHIHVDFIRPVYPENNSYDYIVEKVRSRIELRLVSRLRIKEHLKS